MIELPDGYRDNLCADAELTLSPINRLIAAVELALSGKVNVSHSLEVTTRDGGLVGRLGRWELNIESAPTRLAKQAWKRLFPGRPATSEHIGGYCPASGMPEDQGMED